MAYPYYPATYQPYQQSYYQPAYTQQAMQQPVMQQNAMAAQPQQQTTTQPTYNTGRIWVNGKSEVDFYPVAPNSAVDLWDRNGTTLYQKKADATGRPSVTVYDVTERTQDAMEQSGASDVPVPAYATKDELGAVVGVVKGFDDVLAGIKTDIETMKGDLYGVAGRKKSTTRKAVEVTDDE